MKKNMGIIDRTIRIIIAIVIGILYYLGYLHGAWAIILGILAAIFFITALFARCPMYTLFGFSSCCCKNETDSKT